jgi:hypothetical protein
LSNVALFTTLASHAATVQATPATPDNTAELSRFRADIATGATTLTGEVVHGATVSYVKATVGGAALGTPDGAGLFVQAGTITPNVTVGPQAVPAIFIGIDTRLAGRPLRPMARSERAPPRPSP